MIVPSLASPPPRRSSLSYGLLVLALIVAAFQTAPQLRRPLEMDEQVTYYLATGETPATVYRRSMQQSATPPLYFWLVRASWQVRSESLGSPEFWLRLPAWLAMLAAIVAIFFVAETIVGTGSGGPAALMLASHTDLLHYGTQSRPYTLGILLAIVALGFLFRLRSPNWSWGHVAGFVLMNAALLWTHYLFAVVLVGEVFLLLIGQSGTGLRPAMRSGDHSTHRQDSGATMSECPPLPLVPLMGLVLLPVLSAVPLVGGALRVVDEREGLNWITVVAPWHRSLTLLGPWLAVVGTLAAAIILWLLQRRTIRTEATPATSRLGWSLTCAFAIPAVLLWSAGHLISPAIAERRYAVVLLGPVTLLVTFLLRRLAGAKWLPALAMLFLMLSGTPQRLTAWSNSVSTEAADPWQAAARLLNEQARAGDLILVQSGLVETRYVPAYYADAGFQEYTTSRLSDFYLHTHVKRLALPLVWIPGEWMTAYRESIDATCQAKGTIWLVIAADTDLGQQIEQRTIAWLRESGLHTSLVAGDQTARVHAVRCRP